MSTDLCDASDGTRKSTGLPVAKDKEALEAQQKAEQTHHEEANLRAWEQRKSTAFLARQAEYFDRFKLIPVSALPIYDCFAVLLTDVLTAASSPLV